MSFYIQPIYSVSAGHAQDLYFTGQIKNMRIDDNYNSLWISGTYWIKSNSHLPSYSYYLDINSEFGQVLNVPLFFQRQIERVNKPNSSAVLATVDEYTFNYNFNLAQSSYFDEYIKSKSVNFHFAPMFNQKVVDDLEVQTSTTDLQKFVADINKSGQSRSAEYANLFELNPGGYGLMLNKLTIPQSINLNVNVNKFNSRKIFSELISFNGLDSKFNLLEAKIILTPQNGINKSIELQLFDTLYATNTVKLNIDHCIMYDDNKQVLVEKYIPNMTGIFVDNELSVKMEATIKFEYKKCVRTIKLKQLLNFNKLEISDELNKFVYDQRKNIELSNEYKELISEKIFQ